MNQEPNLSIHPKSHLKANQILVGALLIGIIIFATIIIFLNQSIGQVLEEKDSFETTFFKWAAVIVGGVLVFVAHIIYRKQTNLLKMKSLTINERLNQYRSILIKFMALCEGGALFSIIIFFLIGDFRVFIITGIASATMALKFPTKKRVFNDLSLDWKDQQEF